MQTRRWKDCLPVFSSLFPYAIQKEGKNLCGSFRVSLPELVLTEPFIRAEGARMIIRVTWSRVPFLSFFPSLFFYLSFFGSFFLSFFFFFATVTRDKCTHEWYSLEKLDLPLSWRSTSYCARTTRRGRSIRWYIAAIECTSRGNVTLKYRL